MNVQLVLTAMLPEHLLLLGIVGLMLLAVTGRGQRAGPWLAVLSVAAAAVAAAWLSLNGFAAAPFAGQFSVQPSGLLAKAVVLALALPVLLMPRNDWRDAASRDSEFPLLLLASLYGASLMQSADSFLTLFLGLEILSLPLYALVLLAWQRPQSAEGALKYLVLGGTASATLLMGASLLYGATGSLGISAFADALASGNALSRTAVVLVLLAFFLKAAIVPFHGWAPDAYEAASVPVTAYMAVIVKAAVLLAAARLFGTAEVGAPVLGLLAALPLASIAWGNLAAMRQPGLRRMIAYSAIAHAGYLFLALLGAAEGRGPAIVFYLLAYGLMNLLLFAALPAANGPDPLDRRDHLDRLDGLYQRAPFSAVMIALAMLSLAGLPPLPGFVAKFMIFRSVVAAGHTTIAVLGLVGSYLGIYFYLRVIQRLFMRPAADPAAPTVAAGLGAVTLGAGLAGLALLVAVFPGWVMAWF